MLSVEADCKYNHKYPNVIIVYFPNHHSQVLILIYQSIIWISRKINCIVLFHYWAKVILLWTYCGPFPLSIVVYQNMHRFSQKLKQHYLDMFHITLMSFT
jgi:hypothetical protein